MLLGWTLDIRSTMSPGRGKLPATVIVFAAMSLKEWLGRLQPAPLYTLLALTVTLFVGQHSLSYFTHALTLLMDSYHVLCNIIALAGTIITIKYSSRKADNGADLRNTFGWARIDVLVSLIGSVLLASLSFSLVIEAAQTLTHIDHMDAMHSPLAVLGAGAAGLIVNGLCYLLIGGYTFHQGSFFHVTSSGDVVLQKAAAPNSVRAGQRRLSAQRRPAPPVHRYTQRQGCREMFRDAIGCVLVMACALTVFFTDDKVAKYVDPIFSIVSAILLLFLSYPYMKEAGLILLQTIPEHMDINTLRTDLQEAFPDILNMHDFHVWRLTHSRVFCTVHVVFREPKEYLRVHDELEGFFVEQGVTHVTIQPEFHKPEAIDANHPHVPICLMSCPGESCIKSHCCLDDKPAHQLRSVSCMSLPAKGSACEVPKRRSAPPYCPGSVALVSVSASAHDIRTYWVPSPSVCTTSMPSVTVTTAQVNEESILKQNTDHDNEQSKEGLGEDCRDESSHSCPDVQDT